MTSLSILSEGDELHAPVILIAILKKELRDILSNRKYMAGLVIQLALLLTIIPAFSSILSENNLELPAPTMKDFVPVGVVGKSADTILGRELSQNDKLDVTYYDSFPAKDLKNGRIAAVIEIPDDYDENTVKKLFVRVTILSSSIKRESANDAISASIDSASSIISRRWNARLKLDDTAPITIERQFLKPVVIEKEGMRFSSFFLGYLIPIVLFFPIFMSGGLVVDSIVGEKERKTIESLLTSPVRRSSIVFGKFINVFGFITLQCLVWLLAISIQGVPVTITNLAKVFVLLAALNAGVISTAFLLATYSRSVKEANVSLMLMYVFVFTAIILSLSAEFFNPIGFFEINPFNSISRLVVGEPVGPFTYLFQLFFLGAYSGILIYFTSKIFERDDVIFGPRPGVFHLFSDGIDAILNRFEKRPGLGISFVSVFSSVVTIPVSILLEISIGVVFLYLFGYGNASLFLMIIAFAMVEEFMKPLVLLSIKRSRPGLISDPKRRAFYGALCGFGFFLLENAFIVLIALFSVPSMIIAIITMRAGTTLVIHVVSSGIVGIGISKTRTLYLSLFLLASGIHALYNLVLVGWAV